MNELGSPLSRALAEVGDAFLRRAHPRSTRGAEVLRRVRRRRTIRLTAFVGAGVAGVAAVMIALTVATPFENRPVIEPAPPVEKEQGSPAVVAHIPVAERPFRLAVTDGPTIASGDAEVALWVGHGRKIVERIDVTSGTIAERFHTPYATPYLVSEGRGIFYSDPLARVVTSLQPDGDAGPTYGYLVTTLIGHDGDLWAATSGEGNCPGTESGSCVHKFGLYESELTADNPVWKVGCCPTFALAVEDGRAWVSSGDDGGHVVVGIDIDGSRPPVPIRLKEAPTDLLIDGDVMWAALPKSSLVARIDLARPRSEPQLIEVDRPLSLALDGDSLWCAGLQRVTRLNTETNRVEDELEVGDSLDDIALAGGFVWVSDTKNAEVIKIDPGS